MFYPLLILDRSIWARPQISDGIWIAKFFLPRMLNDWSMLSMLAMTTDLSSRIMLIGFDSI
jgi:hypothetical protein